MSDAKLNATIEAIAAVYMLLGALFYQHLVRFIRRFSQRTPPSPQAISFMGIAAGVIAIVVGLKAVIDFVKLA